MKEIDKYMTVSEAAHRWGISQDTIKNKLKPSVKYTWAKTEKMLEDGLLKYYQKPGAQRKEWIITTEAMELWFGKKE
ncbi:helix-turn-helix domain-containing protein [Heyndrickxia sporothermodurans]|uniref:helix-turn-helix domain-containing protein n=1 Tax=Heyndrickxia sporothermodurans TaxID=46224 RepID=UPI002DBEC8A8|nr:helix-turn-helix domain-containing protein [Heyndrickxia sporothermodurans]MEB6549052.1 helix-turn-helix domain-containing protein [Heyndrickxia sporothermodurans]MED1711693.1 helix-turn-helix domain-containing protein [Bacillus thuringiensis]